jgi:hypothetical protein
MNRCVIALVAALISSASQARADWDTGYAYEIDLINFPVDAVFNVTLDLTEKTIGNLTVKETIIPAGPNSWWLHLDFQTIDGGPLATVFDEAWSLKITSLQATGESFFDAFYFYWSTDGTPAPSIVPFSIFPVVPIPSDPGAGDAYVAGGPPVGPLTIIPFEFYLDRYGPTLSNGGMDPQAINGFHMGFHLFTVPIPAPSPLTLGSIGLVAVGLLKRPRFRPVEVA